MKTKIKKYKNILLALELNTKGDRTLIEKAKLLAKQTGAKISIVHAIEHLAGGYNAGMYGVVSVATEIEDSLMQRANIEMGKIGKQLGVARKNHIVEIGSAKLVVLETADELKADLIIIGSRGTEGIRLFLGSTANAVLHGAKCDVLAVRIK